MLMFLKRSETIRNIVNKTTEILPTQQRTCTSYEYTRITKGIDEKSNGGSRRRVVVGGIAIGFYVSATMSNSILIINTHTW